jgi:MFS family permease
MRDYVQALRAFSPSLRRLFLMWLLAGTAAFGLQAVLLNLFLLRLGFDARFIGLLAGLGQLVWAAMALPASRLVSRLGLRNSLLLGLGLYGLGLALLLLVESLPPSLWRSWLLGSQGVMSVAAALFWVALPAYVMAVTGARERPHAFAALQVLTPATALAGSLLAGKLPGLLAGALGLTLDQAEPYRLALWLAPLLMGLSLLPLLRADPAPLPAPEAQQTGQQSGGGRPPVRLLVWFGGVALLAAIGSGTVNTFFNVYLDRALGVAPAAIGTVMGLAQLLPMLVACVVPLLLTRWGSGHTLLSGYVGLALGLLLLGLVPLLGVAALAYMAILAVQTLAETGRNLFGQELVPPAWRTLSQAAAMLGQASGLAAAAIGGGLLVETLGFGPLFAAGALSVLLAAGLLLGYLRTAPAHPALPAETPLPVPE